MIKRRLLIFLSLFLVLTMTSSCARLVERQVRNRISDAIGNMSNIIDQVGDSGDTDPDGEDENPDGDVDLTDNNDTDSGDTDQPAQAGDAIVLFPGLSMPSLSGFNHDFWEADAYKDIEAPPANITAIATSDGNTQYTFSDMEIDAFHAYINLLRELGFVYEASYIQNFSYGGTREDGLSAQIMLFTEAGDGTLNYVVHDDVDRSTVFVALTGTNRSYDPSEVGGVPDLGNEITGYSVNVGSVTYTFSEIKSAKEVVDAIKASGYTEDVFSAQTETSITYSAKNKDGHSIYFLGEDESGGMLIFSK